MNSGSEPSNKKALHSSSASDVEPLTPEEGDAVSAGTHGDKTARFEKSGTNPAPSTAVSPLTGPPTPSADTHNGQGVAADEAADPLLDQSADAAPGPIARKSPPAIVVILVGLLLLGLGLSFNLAWLTLIGALLSCVLAWGLIWPSVQGLLAELSPQQRSLLIALPAFFISVLGLMQATGVNRLIQAWGRTVRWEVVGALGDFLGAIGQIFVAMLALYVAWRQYVISRDLTVQQNRITQQQTIDAYFQGISELVLDDEGLLEDWPQERIIAEARTAAILSSIDAPGKAKVIRFLSRSKLLTPLQRDRHLGRPILDGSGGYAEDRQAGLRVISLGAMLANADLSSSDLRWTDLSDVNLIRANLGRCDLVRANFSRTILYYAQLSETDLMGARFFYGTPETASPRSRTEPPNFTTGEYTGAVIEGADLSGTKRMSEEQRQYCCRWGGERTRATIPDGCEGIPNCLER
ncbi:MAG: pentapeptide repeat-containing protein [Leptolyngbya sp. SIO1E4]|nr:pentapeptide repeat-containing protein [Leptolyngbya sp. SIO1E4]